MRCAARNGASGRSRLRRRRLRSEHEAGFTVVETMVALGLIFSVTVGLASSMNTGVKGLLTGRQRDVATAYAKGQVEQARAADWNTIGHVPPGVSVANLSCATDATLSGDVKPSGNLAGSAPNYTYTAPDAGSPTEPLAVPTSLASNNCTGYPANNVHQWTTTVDNTTLTTKVYVTCVTVNYSCDTKRVTVEVTYGPDQFNSPSIPNVVRVSSLLSPPLKAPRPTGSSDATVGMINVVNNLVGSDFKKVYGTSAVVHADANGNLAGEHFVHGKSYESTLVVQNASGTQPCNAGPPSVNSAASDFASPPQQYTQAPVPGCTATQPGNGNPLDSIVPSASTGAGTMSSQSSTQSGCATCSGTGGVWDNDLMMAGLDTSSSGAFTVGWTSPVLAGNLFSQNGVNDQATATIDQDNPGGAGQKVSSTSEGYFPPMSIITFNPTSIAGQPVTLPLGFTSAVNISPADIKVDAEAGLPGSSTASPSVTVVVSPSVSVYTTTGVSPGYTYSTVAPGSCSSQSFHAAFNVATGPLGLTIVNVTIDTTVTGGCPATSRTPSSGSPITAANAAINNMFVISCRYQAAVLGLTQTDMTETVNYGNLSASAGYQ